MFFKCPEGYLFDSQLEPEPDCAPADQVKSCDDVVIPKPIPKKEFEIHVLTLHEWVFVDPFECKNEASYEWTKFSNLIFLNIN